MNNSKPIVALTCGWLVLAGALVWADEPSAKPEAPAQPAAKAAPADEAARLQAVDQVASQSDKAEAVAPLIEALKDSSPAVRAHAARALGQLGAIARPAAMALVTAIADPDHAVRRQAVRALRAIRPGQEVTLPLFVKLLEDSDPGVRMRVLGAISETGAEAVPSLIKALQNDKAAYWICLILRDIGPTAKEAVPALVEKLHDPRPEIRREVVLALAAMEDAAVAAAPQIALLLDDQHVRTAATYALGRIGRIPADAETKIQANAKGDDKLLAAASLWALARVHPEDKDLRRQVTEVLIERLKDKDPHVRAMAAQALSSLPPAPEITMPIWEKALADADEATLRNALDALAGLGAPAVPKLIAALKFEHLRGRVAYILGQIGPAAAPATEALAGLIDDNRPRVSAEAVLALAKIGPGAKAAVPALLKSFQKGDDANNHAIAYALGKIGPDAAAAQPALEAALKGGDDSLALVSAWALGKINPGSADVAGRTIPVLIVGLTAPLPQSRQAAAEALGNLGPLAKEAVPALEKAGGDPDANVSKAVAEALKSIGAKPQTPEAKTPAAKTPGTKTIQSGSVVVTLKSNVPIRRDTFVLARLPKGSQLTVLEVRGQWVGVRYSMGGNSVAGWVLQTEVGVR
jgi:HEAT repeat protein